MNRMQRRLARGGALLAVIALGAGTFGLRPLHAQQTDRPIAVADGAPDAPQTYRTECGSCHMVYPPGLLPGRSWQRMLGGLEDHFGQNAELDAPTRTLLGAWLVQNAAESGRNRRGTKILRSIGGETPLRISDTPYIRRKHDEMSEEVFGRPAVGGRANCMACHEQAEQGLFDDDTARVPR